MVVVPGNDGRRSTRGNKLIFDTIVCLHKIPTLTKFFMSISIIQTGCILGAQNGGFLLKSIHENIFIPVGTAIIIVAAKK